MALIKAAFDFIEELDRHNDVETLLKSFQMLIERYGFSNFCVGDPSHPKLQRNDRLWATTWPQDWVMHWFHKNYITFDPVIHQLTAHNMPFRWSDMKYRNNGLAARVMNEATDFGMKDGFGVPVYSGNGSIIGVTMSAEHYEVNKSEEACLHLAAIYFQARFERLRPQSAGEISIRKLTPRERECLSWVAAGKSDWDISQILGISEDTAHEYVHNAIAKLNATTRAQAVAIGLIERVITV
jgi:LuxR family quorum sensing-dependent transcriptional regulator